MISAHSERDKMIDFAFDDEHTQEQLDYINQMSHLDMAYMHRFAEAGHPYFNRDFPELVEAFEKRWALFGKMTPEISKRIGW